MTTVRTAHRQFGSKARVAAQLAELVPEATRVWVEVFAGTAAVTLAKIPHPAEHLNDMNGDIVNLFTVMRNDEFRNRLIASVEFTPWSEEEFIASRERDSVADPVERARLFLVSSWQGVAGKQGKATAWRLEKKNGGHVGVWRGVPERLAAVGQRLRHAYIHRKDAIAIVRQFGDVEDACLFIDLPYPEHSLATFGAQYALSMSDEQHASFVDALSTIKAKAIVTMNPGTIYDRLSTEFGWHMHKIKIRGLRSTVKEEFVFTNFIPVVGLGSGLRNGLGNVLA